MCFLDLKTALCDFQLGDFRFSDGHKKPSAMYPQHTEGKQPTKSIIRLSDHNLTNNRWVSTRVQIWENQGHIKPQKSSKFTNMTCSELVLAKYFSFWKVKPEIWPKEKLHQQLAQGHKLLGHCSYLIYREGWVNLRLSIWPPFLYRFDSYNKL